MTHIILMKLRVNDASKGKPTSSRKLSRWLTCSFIEDRFKLTWSFNDWSSVLKLSSFLALWKRIIKLEIINWINLALKINILNISLDLFMQHSYLYWNLHFYQKSTKHSHTGKSLSEALILGSTNPEYDKRLFIENYNLRTYFVHNLFFSYCFDIQNNLCTHHVLSL